MTEYREKLIDRMIRIYGFEHPVVIHFAEMCEDSWWMDEVLETVVKSHEENPYMGEDDE